MGQAEQRTADEGVEGAELTGSPRSSQVADVGDRLRALLASPADLASEQERVYDAKAEQDWPASIERVRRIASQVRQTNAPRRLRAALRPTCSTQTRR